MNIRSLTLERAYDCRLSFAHADLLGLGTIVGSAINLGSQQLTNETNMDIAAMNNRTSIELAREANANQLKAMRENNKFNAEQAELARQWDSPAALKGRLLEAGLNPAVAMSQGLTSHSTSASASGSGISPIVPTLQQARVEPLDFVGGVQGIASAMAQLSQAKKDDVDAKRVKSMLADELELLHANASMAKFENLLQSMFAGQERNLGVQKLKLDVSKGAQELLNLVEQGDYIHFNTSLTRQKIKSERLLQNIQGVNHDILKNELNHWFDTWQTEMNSKRASANQANTQASINRQTAHAAERENKIIDSYNVTKDGINPLREWTRQKLESALHQNALTDWQKNRIEEMLPSLIEQAQNDAETGKPWTLTYFVHRLLGVAGSGMKDAALLMLAK